MDFHIGRCFFILLFAVISFGVSAQKIYVPQHSSDLLQSTAKDLTQLLNKSVNQSSFSIEEYAATIPATGIILIYDSSVTENQSCKIEGNGSNLLKFSASQDNGLCFGIYTYLQNMGFRFYLPGTIWEKIPTLTSAFQNINTTVTGSFKYNTWFISGGHNRWVMDNDNSFGWDTYFGENGHAWATYQRRNNMTGAYRFNGHRGDVMSGNFLSTLQQNPCYVACFNGSRAANSQSVPDVNNQYAKQLWASTIQQKFSDYKTIITGNTSLYKNEFHNFDYYNQLVGIEVADGGNWGNSTDNAGCLTGNFNGKPYPKESDQQFLLANFTAQKINNVYGDKHFQCYAYSNHADVPSSEIAINNKIDVQVVAGAFQFETSTKGLLNRWYQRHSNVSEYYYMNIPQWTGETPMFSLADYKNTLQRLQQKHSNGIVVESSPAKFASLPFLFAGTNFLNNNIPVDSSLQEFVSNMFPGECGIHIMQLLKYWGDENVSSVGNFTNDNKYKIPLYLQQVNLAITASQNASADVKARLQELKAYLHYMVLYFDFMADNRPVENKILKAEALCLYLAKINKLQLVNSYFLIMNVVNKYPANNAFFLKYNVENGAAYLGGNLALITNEEINNNYNNDLAKYTSNANYIFENAATIISKMKVAGLKPLEKINVKIRYTNGFEYSNRSEFYFVASKPGKVLVSCTPHFGMGDKGFINITAEADDKPLAILTDETLKPGTTNANINVVVPEAGVYKLSFVSKFQTSVDVCITTNGNTFFKKGAFYGEKVEDYSSDINSLPKYFYVPETTGKLLFSVNNACPYNNSCISVTDIKNAFAITDNTGHLVDVNVSATDSSLYSINTSSATANFWQVTKMREYNLCFANISNIEIYAEKNICTGTDFIAKISSNEKNCYTQLIALTPDSAINHWLIYDAGKWYNFSFNKTIDLPILLSSNALITLKSGDCSITKKAGDIEGYNNGFTTCVSSLQQQPPSVFIAYPNPSNGVFSFKQTKNDVVFDQVEVYNSQRKLVKIFFKTSKINISNYPDGVYFCKAKKNNITCNTKLIKN